FHHFDDLASRYWQHRIYPNHVLPDIAPYCPLIHISPTGKVAIHDASAYMVSLTQSQLFFPSERALRVSAMPEAVFQWVAAALSTAGLAVAASASHGRQQALTRCRLYREKRWHSSERDTQRLIKEVGRANIYLNKAGRYSAPLASEPRPEPRISPVNPASDTRKFRAVSFRRHGRMRWQSEHVYTFAAAQVVVPIAACELPQAIMAMPVGFMLDDDQYVL